MRWRASIGGGSCVSSEPTTPRAESAIGSAVEPRASIAWTFSWELRMGDSSMRRFRCWDAATVQHTVFGDIASLGLDADAVFLAAHSSVDLDHTKGIHYE